MYSRQKQCRLKILLQFSKKGLSYYHQSFFLKLLIFWYKPSLTNKFLSPNGISSAIYRQVVFGAILRMYREHHITLREVKVYDQGLLSKAMQDLDRRATLEAQNLLNPCLLIGRRTLIVVLLILFIDPKNSNGCLVRKSQLCDHILY